jgi:hypothetical protein
MATLNVRTTLHRWTISIGVALAIPGCSGPTGPDSLTPERVASLGGDRLSAISVNDGIARRKEATFPLVNGSFTLTLRGTDGSLGTVTGQYSGSATIDGQTSADLDVEITATTGIGSTVTELDVEGRGAFVDEGDVTLFLSFVLSGATPSGDGVIRMIVRGTSRISCSAAQRILVTQRAVGSTPRVGTIEIQLQHEVVNTECFD